MAGRIISAARSALSSLPSRLFTLQILKTPVSGESPSAVRSPNTAFPQDLGLWDGKAIFTIFGMCFVARGRPCAPVFFLL